jgi:hypothetical protein
MNIILEPTLPVGETLETRANKFKSWGMLCYTNQSIINNNK